MATQRAQLRAVLLAIVIATQGWIALPIGPKVTQESIRSDNGKREVDAWMKLAGPLGFTRESFETTVIEWSSWLVELDKVVSAPIRPVLHTIRIGQGWALFSAADDDPLTFQIRGRTFDGEERLLFSRLDPDHEFLKPVFGFRRVRGIYDLGRKTMPPRYHNMAKWAANRAFATYEDLEFVEIVQIEVINKPPGVPPDPTTKERFRLLFERDQ